MAWVDSVVALKEIGTILQTREDFCRVVNCINSLSHLRVLSSQFVGSRRERFRTHPCFILGVLFLLEGRDVERGKKRMED